MDYAPIIIPTLNRIDHLKRLLASLRRCQGAPETELIISVDALPSNNSKYHDGHDELKDYLSKPIEGFKNVTVYYQEKNLGLHGNTTFLINKAFETYDNLILSEDDNEFSPNFIIYMNKCLQWKKSDPKVYSVTAYPSIYHFAEEKNNITFLRMHSVWGCGIWKDKWEYVRETLNYDYFASIIKSRQKCKLLMERNLERFIYCIKLLHYDCPVLFEQNGKDVAILDVTTSILFTVEDLYQVQPIMRKARNWGYDGSGSNCVIDNSVSMEEIDYSTSFDIVYDKSDDKREINAETLYLDGCRFEANYVKRMKFFAVTYRLLGKRISILLYRSCNLFFDFWEDSLLRKFYLKLKK